MGKDVRAWVGFTLWAVEWSIGFMLGDPYYLFYPLSRLKNILTFSADQLASQEGLCTME